MKYRKEIDYLKAFSIILVVLFHGIFYTGIFWNHLFYICLYITLRNVHVPLFILLAGYLCHKQNLRTYYLKKLRRILIPFLFMSVLKLLLGNLFFPEFVHEGTLAAQVYDAFICGGLYWFCYALLVLYLLAPLFWNREVLIWVLLILTLGINIFLQRQELELTNILQLSRVLSLFPYFLTGMLLSRYHLTAVFQKKRTILIGLFLALGAGAVTGYFRFHEDVYNSYYLDFIMGLSLMLLLFLLSEGIAAAVKSAKSRKTPIAVIDQILTASGRYSLQIMFFEGFYRSIGYQLFALFIPDGIGQVLLIVVFVLACSWGTCRILEKIPGLSFLTGLEAVPARDKN